MSQHRVLVLGPLVAALLAVAPVSAQDKSETQVIFPSILEGLPASTTLVVRSRSNEGFLAKVKKTPLYKLRNHPDVKKFIEDLTRELDLANDEGKSELGFGPRELLEHFDHEVVVALGNLDKVVSVLFQTMAMVAGGPGGPPGSAAGPELKPEDVPILIAGTATEEADAVREKLQKLHEKMQKDDNARIEVEEFRGGKITTLTNPAKVGTGDVEKLYFGELGTTFFLSVNRAYLEATIVGMTDGPGDKLEDDPEFQHTQRVVGENADFLGFVNVRSIMDSIRKPISAQPLYQMFFNLIEKKIVGTGLANIAMTLNVQSDRLLVDTFAHTGGVRDGIWALFDATPFNVNSVAQGVPPSVDSFSVTTFDFGKFYQLARELANTAMGAAQGNPSFDVEQLLELQLQVKMDELVGAFGNRLLQLAWAAEDGASATELNPLGNFIIGFELEQEKPVEAFLARLPVLLSQNFFVSDMKIERYLEEDLYFLSSEGPILAVVDSKLLLAIEPEKVKDLVRRSGKEGVRDLAADEDFRRVASEFPAQLSSVSFMRKSYLKDNLRSVNEMARTTPLGASPQEQFQLFDLTILADAFGDGGGYGVWKDKGLYSRSWVRLEGVGND